MNDQHGEVHFHLVPYAEPAAIRNIFEEESIRSHQDAMQKLLSISRKTWTQVSVMYLLDMPL